MIQEQHCQKVGCLRENIQRNVAIAIVLIVVITAGLYLGLAYTFPVQSAPVILSGILTQTEISVFINWPNSQLQVHIQSISVSAIWSYEIRNSPNNIIDFNLGIDTSTTFVITPWLASTGIHTIIKNCRGNLEGIVTVFACGVPFIIS